MSKGLAGRRIRRLLADDLPAGTFTATWDGRDDAGRELPSGVYLVRLVMPSIAETTKAVLIR